MLSAKHNHRRLHRPESMLKGDEESENMDDEGIPEIASIHQSP